jgi:hypothetical protein
VPFHSLSRSFLDELCLMMQSCCTNETLNARWKVGRDVGHAHLHVNSAMGPRWKVNHEISLMGLFMFVSRVESLFILTQTNFYILMM